MVQARCSIVTHLCARWCQGHQLDAGMLVGQFPWLSGESGATVANHPSHEERTLTGICMLACWLGHLIAKASSEVHCEAPDQGIPTASQPSLAALAKCPLQRQTQKTLTREGAGGGESSKVKRCLTGGVKGGGMVSPAASSALRMSHLVPRACADRCQAPGCRNMEPRGPAWPHVDRPICFCCCRADTGRKAGEMSRVQGPLLVMLCMSRELQVSSTGCQDGPREGVTEEPGTHHGAGHGGASWVRAPFSRPGAQSAACVGARSLTGSGWAPEERTAGAAQLHGRAQLPSVALLKPSASPHRCQMLKCPA